MSKRYCVIKDTTSVVVDGWMTEELFLADAMSAGLTTEQVEILTQSEYDARKAIVSLDVLKERKSAELNDACNSTILGRFKATIDDIEYEFSYDYDAQLRFTGIGVMFNAGKLNEIEWTAYQNNERVRIALNQANFDTVTLAALYHQNYNVTKFNQLLQQVTSAITKEQVEAIVW